MTRLEQFTKDQLDSWMQIALDEAALAQSEGEVPVGAVVVSNGHLIAREHNRSIQLADPTAHAEILALRSAGLVEQNYRLNGTVLFVTVEPCAMCAGALIWARVSSVVFGTLDEKSGAVSSKATLLEPGLFNHTVEVVGGVRSEECRDILRNFFEARRGRT